MLMMFVVIRLDPSGSTAGRVTAVSAKTIPSVWVVRAGQTYELIAERTGLSVAQLEYLNPHTDPGTLDVGAAIRLRAPQTK
jgi:LysM repeat protein